VIAFLGIPVLVWFVVAFGVSSCALGILIARCIRWAEEGPGEIFPSGEPEDPADLDDWLGQDGLDFNFSVHQQPEASVRVGGSDGLR